jgi:hypothetical protein
MTDGDCACPLRPAQTRTRPGGAQLLSGGIGTAQSLGSRKARSTLAQSARKRLGCQPTRSRARQGPPGHRIAGEILVSPAGMPQAGHDRSRGDTPPRIG